ncbi:MAG: hypothetical protein DCF22_00675 [Leptolyngbya sp.]|nr:MAG: hypothetical protein DCF22_00675 [Leptolyngbya sp.]
MSVDERVMLFEPGDRVRVIRGNSLNKTGEVVEYQDGKVIVKSDKGLVKPFPPTWLAHVSHSDPIPWDVGAEPLQNESHTQQVVDNGFSPPSSSVEAEPLRMLTPTPTSSLTLAPTLDEAEPLHCDAPLLTPTPINSVTFTEQVYEAFEAEPLQALEMLRERLQKTALTNAWLESAGRGYVRLVWHKSMSKPPEYVDAKDVAMWRDRIAAGRALAHCDALLKYLRSLDENL